MRRKIQLFSAFTSREHQLPAQATHLLVQDIENRLNDIDSMIPRVQGNGEAARGLGVRRLAVLATESNSSLLAPLADRTLLIERGALSEQIGAPKAA